MASSATAPMIIRVRPTSRVTAELDSSTVTFSPRSPSAVLLITLPVGRLPSSSGARPGILISA